MAGGHGPNPVVSAYEAWRARTPLVCRKVCEVLVCAYAVSWVFDLSAALSVVPFFVVRRLQVYRLVLSPLVGNSLISVLLTVLTVGDGVGPRLERSLGSMRLAALVASSVVGVNVAFVALCYAVVSLGALDAALFTSRGLWHTVLTLVAVECLSGPEAARRLLCLPVDVPRLYYPVALGALWMLFSGGLGLDIPLAVGFGYLDNFGYLDAMIYRPLAARCGRFDSACADSHADYISARAALGAAAWVPVVADAREAGPSVSQRLSEAYSSIMTRAAPADARDSRFPDAGGRVLGVDPTEPLLGEPAAPQRTAAQNRSTILAAAEARSAQEKRKHAGANHV
ncbi:hypothetical protein M885DRAFT_562312 [Pelagophyceae sp. CCMP2097]|nr:hypothetical protein M885DRAFT_562312 [Pelagophyceae sp. CCMP2097]